MIGGAVGKAAGAHSPITTASTHSAVWALRIKQYHHRVNEGFDQDAK